MNAPNCPGWYLRWVQQHAMATACRTEESIKTFAAWWPYFADLQYSEQELYSATTAIMHAGAFPKLADQFHAIKRAIGQARNQALAKRQNEGGAPGKEWGRCDACGNTGWVTVPHLEYADPKGWRPVRYNAHGDPIYATLAVVCNCFIGQAIHTAQLSRVVEKKLKAASMTLSEYTERNYPWRAQLLEEREARMRRSVPRDGDALAEVLAAEDRMRAMLNRLATSTKF